MYDDEGPKRYVRGDKKKGIHSRLRKEDLKLDLLARTKAKEILVDQLGFKVVDYEQIIIELAKEAKAKGQRVYEAFLKKHDIESEYGVPDLKFTGKGWWGYLECEVLKHNVWSNGKFKYPDTVRFPNRKSHFAEDLKYRDEILWYCQFCYEDMDLHHIFSVEAMRRATESTVRTCRDPDDDEVFLVIPKGWHYENGLLAWNPDKVFDKR